MTELLDWKTIWNETYRSQYIRTDGGGYAKLITALHGMDGRIRLFADIEITIDEGYASASLKLPLSPEEMETLADYLVDAAEFQRDQIKRLDAHNAAQEVVSEGEARQAEAA